MKLLTVAAAAAIIAGPAAATTLRVTVTHDNGTPLFITPLYTAFHDENFDAFNVNEAASAGLELLAETGMAGLIAQERVGNFPLERPEFDMDSVGAALEADAGPGPIFSGFVGPGIGNPAAQTASNTFFDIDGSEMPFFTFLSMILPSNDTFIGRDQAVRLFDDDGNFIGDSAGDTTRTINVTGLDIFDAGTEVNDATTTGGAAFVQGADIAAGAAEGGVVTQSDDNTLAAFANVGLAPPPTPGNLIGTLGAVPDAIDFFSDRANFNLVTITIEDISEVPLPAGNLLLLSALGMGGIAARRKAKKA